MSEFGTYALAAGVNTIICENTSPGKILTLTFNILNRTDAAINVTAAISTTSSPVDGQFIEDLQLPEKSGLERAGIVLRYGQKIIANAESTGVNAVTWGVISYE